MQKMLSVQGSSVLTVTPNGFNLTGDGAIYDKAASVYGVDRCLQNSQGFVTFVHLLFSVRFLDLLVASLVFMKGTSCCLLGGILSTVQ